MGTADSREYDRLKERGFKPYSKGHRSMYEKGIAHMKFFGFDASARVLEAGFGIGWGLDRMVEEKLLRSYVGYEPNKDSFDYVNSRYETIRALVTAAPLPDMLLLRLPFEPNLDPAFDVAFCIEVIEHVPMAEQEAFLRGLCQMAPTLYFSTPDKRRQPSEGVRTDPEWLALLAQAGFLRVYIDTSEWTTFYRCER